MTDEVSLENDDNLDHSRPICMYWRCDNSELNNLVNELVSLMREQHVASGRRSNNFRVNNHLDMCRRIIMDLHVSYLSDPSKWLAVSMNRNFYSINNRYQPTIGAYSVALRVKEFLENRGFIESRAGFNDRTRGIGRRTRIKATPLLAERLTGVSLCQYYKESETVILKSTRNRSGRAEVIDYVDSDLTIQMRQELERINHLLKLTWIDLHITDESYNQLRTERPINFENVRLERIFNNSSFQEGGRFYKGWWIEVPKQYRPYITIDAEPTIELDYSSMHLRIIYAEERQELPSGDLYQLEGYQERSIIKAAFMRACNCTSKNEAVNSLFGELDGNYTRQQIEALFDAFERKHFSVSHRFYRAGGYRLQNIDSQIANKTMLLLAEQEIVALPVHDSFIVKRVHEEQLLSAMTQSFREVVGSEVTIDRTLEEDIYRSYEAYDSFEDMLDDYSEYNNRKNEFESWIDSLDLDNIAYS